MQYIFASRISGAPITNRGGSSIDRVDLYKMTGERVIELLTILKEDARITTPEDAFAIVLNTLVITFKNVLSFRVMAQGLNVLAEHLLKITSDEDRQNGEKYPQGPEDISPEEKIYNSHDHISGARPRRIVCDVHQLDLTQICPPPPDQFGSYSRMITIKETANTGRIEIVMNADEPDKLRFPGELTGGAVPPSAEFFE
jgi:hypothetical protein